MERRGISQPKESEKTMGYSTPREAEEVVIAVHHEHEWGGDSSVHNSAVHDSTVHDSTVHDPALHDSAVHGPVDHD